MTLSLCINRCQGRAGAGSADEVVTGAATAE